MSLEGSYRTQINRVYFNLINLRIRLFQMNRRTYRERIESPRRFWCEELPIRPVLQSNAGHVQVRNCLWGWPNQAGCWVVLTLCVNQWRSMKEILFRTGSQCNFFNTGEMRSHHGHLARSKLCANLAITQGASPQEQSVLWVMGSGLHLCA